MSDASEIVLAPSQDMSHTVDEAVAEKLPTGSAVQFVQPLSGCHWAKAFRVDVELPDETKRSYFLKVTTRDDGRSMLNGEYHGLGMMKGEYHGAVELYGFIRENVPKPLAWGTYRANPETHFYLCHFIKMDRGLPDMTDFCAALGKLHLDSMTSKWNPGKFGFDFVTYEGTMYQDNTWCEEWEEAFTRHMKVFVKQEEEKRGPSEELKELLPALYDKVIPRLLRPLQAHGRSITPALVHGDIWHGNISTSNLTKKPVMFDASVFWGHNEYDLDNVLIDRYGMGEQWMREYHSTVRISDPEDDHEDRNALYAIRAHFCASTLYEDSKHRDEAIKGIRELVKKYPNGYDKEEDAHRAKQTRKG